MKSFWMLLGYFILVSQTAYSREETQEGQLSCPEILYPNEIDVLKEGFPLYAGAYKLALPDGYKNLEVSQDSVYHLAQLEKRENSSMWHCHYKTSSHFLYQKTFVLEAVLETLPLRDALDEIDKMLSQIPRLRLYSYDRDKTVRDDFISLTKSLENKLQDLKQNYLDDPLTEIPTGLLMSLESFTSRKHFPQDLGERKAIFLKADRTINVLKGWLMQNREE